MGKKKDVRIGYGFDLSGLLKEVQAIDRKQGSKLKSLKSQYQDHVIYIVKFMPITLTPPTSTYI